PHYYGSYIIDVPGTWMALDNAIESIERARELMANGELAESNLMLDDVLNEIADAQNSTQARKWDFPIAIKIMELQREAAAAALDVAMLNLEAAQDMIEDAVIEAPFAGVITVVLVEEGDTLTSMNYFNPAFHIIDPTNLEMTGLIDEMDIADISIDQKAIVTMDALPGVEVIGSVTYVSEAAMIEAGVVMYQTTVSLDNADSNIKDGMSATADIVREERENVLMLPASTVMSEDGQTVVYLVGADGKLEMRSVTTGLHSGRMIEITAGLVEGDLVALEAPE
ncbi:MAG: efflux RND transporter periplasmic adaptor subunit, partial [Dehalococcoidia bacterium]|nr:efflux RND transporter periplasmic adaptor subunit [Dehalococcoidia bacterium]